MQVEPTNKPVEPFGDNRIKISKGNLEKVKRETWEVITRIRASADEMENNRRIKEEERRDARTKKIANEIYSNETKNIGVIFNWQQIEKMENTEELAKEVAKQNEECKKIIDSKEALIKELEDELIGKDEEYKDSLKRMGMDVDSMIEAMRKQFYDMRNEYAKELKEIEAAFKRERDEILKRNNKEIERLLKEHDDQEKNNQHLRLTSEEDYSKKLEDDRKKNVIDYMAKKMLLEQEKQSIERALEELKSVFVLNQALLDYNVKVLKEKKTENEQILKDVEEKVKRYRERRAKLKAAIEEAEEKAEKTNAQLTRDFKSASERFSILQAKFQHFKKADQIRYEEIKAMNEAEVKTMMQKIIKADKVIHMQQLGVPWTQPPDYILNYLEGGQGATGMGTTGIIHETSSMAEGSRVAPKSEAGDEKSEITRNLEERTPIVRVNEVFRVLARETGFLVDKKTKDTIKAAPRKERFQMQVEALCNALSIERGDIELLVTTFYDHNAKPSFVESQLPVGEESKMEIKKETSEAKIELGKTEQEEKKEGESPIDIPEAENEDKLIIDMDNVVDILEDFMERRRSRAELPEAAAGVMKRKKKQVESETEKIEKDRKRNREHWERLSHVLDDAKLNLWNALYGSLTKYYGLLGERQNLIEETGLLNQQNEELKTLLNQYLLAGVNNELKVPPTHVIRLGV